MMTFHTLVIVLSILVGAVGGEAKEETLKGSFSEHDVTIPITCAYKLELYFNGSSTVDTTVDFNFTDNSVLQSIPSVIVKAGHNESMIITVNASTQGHTVVHANAMPANMTDFSNAYARVSVSHTEVLDYASDVVGWLYFIAWSVSFYPQTFLNFKRKSVIGLHFDFLALNVVGFLYYSIFNIGMYWIPSIESQYLGRHPFGVNPVQLNDVIFSIHAFFACLIQVVQCLIYDRGEQQVSTTARYILAAIAALTAIAAVLGISSVFQWLDFLYFVSYVKLFITLIKYIPQAYYNYRRKSTSGWSIGNVLLDCTGGSLSIAQMIIIAYNYDDWSSIFGDPTKFGLGLFSIMFDVLFVVQHYALYKGGVTLQPLLQTTSPESSYNSNYGAVVSS